ncbi:MAG: amidohydrolase family protein [Burkholderiaceae bacterium]
MSLRATRRRLIQAGALSVGMIGGTPWALAQSRTDRPFDLLIQGGRVIDPSQGIDTVADIGIDKGIIRAVGPTLSAEGAGKVLDASNKIVTPGLIDAHVHVADGMMPVSMVPDDAGIRSGVTTVIDAGSTGGRTYAGFRKHIIKPAETRIYTLLNIASVGLVVLNELYADPKFISRKRAYRAIRANRDQIIGLKARVRGRPETLEHDISVMKVVREIGEETGLPTMMHWTNQSKLLDQLRPGDYLTHPFNPDYLNPSAVMADGKLFPTVSELKDRGIMVELGHGSSFDWNKAEAAAEQGWFPDVLSTDMFTRYFRPKGVVGDLGSVMSKFMMLGLTLNQVIEKTTIAPVRMAGIPEALGTLKVGAIADITVLEQKQGSFVYVDSPRLKATRTGTEKLTATATVKSGRLYELA